MVHSILHKELFNIITITTKYCRLFSFLSFKCLVGLDDCNSLYPLLYASKSLNKLTIGIQHGAYSETPDLLYNHLSSHIWYDYLIVWGPYFKELFSKYNKIFPSSNLICASNKLNID